MDITAPIFTDADAAREHLEAIRWPHGPICPHCGNADPERITKLEGKSHSSRPLPVQRLPGASSPSRSAPFSSVPNPAQQVAAGDAPAWLVEEGHVRAPAAPHARRHLQDRLVHGAPHSRSDEGRVQSPARSAAKARSWKPTKPIIGKREDPRSPQRRTVPTRKRGKSGRLRSASWSALSSVAAKPACSMSSTPPTSTVRDVLVRNARPQVDLYTDESHLYTRLGEEFAAITPSSIRRANTSAMRTTASSTPTRSRTCSQSSSAACIGVYQHCGEAHLHRYLAEFEFRYNRRSALGVERCGARRAICTQGSKASASPIGGLVKPNACLSNGARNSSKAQEKAPRISPVEKRFGVCVLSVPHPFQWKRR